MPNLYLKIVFSNTLFILSQLIAASGNGDLPPQDNELHTPPSYRGSLSSQSENGSSPTIPEHPFDILMSKLRAIELVDRTLDPWKKAILEYKASFQGSETPAFTLIRRQLLGAPLEIRRYMLAEQALRSLIESASSQSYPSTLGRPFPSFSPHPPTPFAPSQRVDALSLPPSKFHRPVPPSFDPTLLALPASLTFEALDSPHDDTVVGRLAPTADEIFTHLGRFIAGQEEALQSLSFLAHRFLCNKLLVDKSKPVASRPSHCILTGPTGCGKSETIKRLGEFVNAPIMHLNARSLTDEGFKGHNFSEAVAAFCKANKNPRSAIVAVDEVDKLGMTTEESIKNFGKSIQHVLLAPLDGHAVSLQDKTFTPVNWWFIGTGAFSGLKGRHDAKGGRGTTARTHKDIISYGFEPEFVARFHSIIPFSGHTVDTMIGVISKEDSPLDQAKKEFQQFYGVNLIIDEQALRRLAALSLEIDLGVRSLNTVLNSVLRPFYRKAADLLKQGDAQDSQTLTVTLTDIQPVIEQFAQDNKEIQQELPESIRHMYM